MDYRKYLSRFFRSQWTRVFGPAFIVYLVITVGAAAATGDWGIPLLFTYFIIFFLFRMAIIAGLYFFPVWIALIVVWTAHKLLLEKRLKKESNRP